MIRKSSFIIVVMLSTSLVFAGDGQPSRASRVSEIVASADQAVRARAVQIFGLLKAAPGKFAEWLGISSRRAPLSEEDVNDLLRWIEDTHADLNTEKHVPGKLISISENLEMIDSYERRIKIVLGINNPWLHPLSYRKGRKTGLLQQTNDLFEDLRYVARTGEFKKSLEDFNMNLERVHEALVKAAGIDVGLRRLKQYPDLGAPSAPPQPQQIQVSRPGYLAPFVQLPGEVGIYRAY